MKAILKHGGPIMDVLTVESKTIDGPQVWVCEWRDSDGTKMVDRLRPDELYRLMPAAGEQ